MNKKYSITILSDHGDSDKFVGYRLRLDPHGEWLTDKFWERFGLRYARALIRGILFYARARRYRGAAVVVTYAGDIGFVFAGCQYLFRFFSKPIPHLMFDLLLDERRIGFLGLLDDLKTHVFNRAVIGAVVWGKNDVVRFANEFGLKERKLFFHPYHITLDDLGRHMWDVGDDGYIFCGGNVGRDFGTVIRALGPLGYPTIIATQVPGVAEMAKEFSAITVRGVTPIEFRQLMAKSTFVVEAHPKDFFRTAGHQTMLNAMYLGKPLILLDEASSEGYVEDLINGFVLPAEDCSGLTRVAKKLWEDSELRNKLARSARQKATNPIYGTLNHIQSIYNLAIDLHEREENIRGKYHRIKVY